MGVAGLDTFVKEEKKKNPFPFTRFSPHHQSAVAGRLHAPRGNNALLVAQLAICRLRGGESACQQHQFAMAIRPLLVQRAVVQQNRAAAAAAAFSNYSVGRSPQRNS